MGKANLVRPAKGNTPDAAILAYGTICYNAIDAADELEQQGYSIAVYDARFACPVDIDLIRELVEQEVAILTVEDHSLIGGFGSAVLETCNDAGIETNHIKRHGMPNRWVYQDARAKQLAEVGLDDVGIAREVRALLDRNGAAKTKPSIHVDVSNTKITH